MLGKDSNNSCGSRSSKILTSTGKYKLWCRAGASVCKYNLGTRAGKYKFEVWAGKYIFGAKAGKHKLGVRADKK